MIESLEERIGKLLRLNAEDAIARSTDPVRTTTELASDVDNQLIQLKTELVVAVAARHKAESDAAKLDAEAADWIAQASVATTEKRADEARAAAERVVGFRRQTALLRTRARERHELSERLRALYLELQKQREGIERIRARHAAAALAAATSAARAGSPESEVDRLLNQLRTAAKAES